MNFEKPEIKIIDIELEDVIMSSPEVLSFGIDNTEGVNIGTTKGVDVFQQQ